MKRYKKKITFLKILLRGIIYKQKNPQPHTRLGIL